MDHGQQWESQLSVGIGQNPSQTFRSAKPVPNFFDLAILTKPHFFERNRQVARGSTVEPFVCFLAHGQGKIVLLCFIFFLLFLFFFLIIGHGNGIGVGWQRGNAGVAIHRIGDVAQALAGSA